MRRLRLLPLVAVVVVVAGLWGISRHPSVHLWLSSAGARISLFFRGEPGSPALPRPAWPGRIYYLKSGPAGLSVWSIRPDGQDRELLGGPLTESIASWAGTQEFALLVDVRGRAWVAGAGYLRQVETPGLRPETLLVPEQQATDSVFLYGIAKDGDRPVLLSVRPDGAREVFRGSAPAGWIWSHDRKRFVLVIPGKDTWQAVAVDYAGGTVHVADGSGDVRQIDYGSSGEVMVVHTGTGRTVIDGSTWRPTGSTSAWLAPIGSSALLISPGRDGPTAALASPEHLEQYSIWDELTRALRTAAAGSPTGALALVDESRDSVLLATADSTLAPSRQAYAGFLQEHSVVSLGSYPAGGFFGVAGQGFAVAGRLAGDGSVQSVRLVQPTGPLPLWDQVRVRGVWNRVYGLVVAVQRNGKTEAGLLSRNGYDLLARALGNLLVYPGQSAAVIVSGPDEQGRDSLRLVDALTRQVTLLDNEPARGVLWVD